MVDYPAARRRRIRRRLAAPRAVAALLAGALVVAQVVGGLVLGGRAPRALASPSISQVYFTPYEAQEYMGILRGIAGDSGCCTGPLLSTISITSGAAGNTVVYDHFEDGYEIDPYAPVQGSTATLSLDDGDVWTRTSSIPVDQPGRGAGFFFDGRDRIIASAPIAVTQTAYATTPGSLHAGAVEVLDLDKSGTAFDIPVGQNADYNSVFEYVGLMVVANQRDTTVQIDADADGTFETTAPLDEGETRLVAGGVRLGARVVADHPVAVYVLTGDVGARYEGRDFELYPTAVWSSQLVTPVGARSTGAADGTRVFLFNPGNAAVVVDVATSAGAAGTVNLAARGQGTFRVPVDQGARFTARNGAPIYAFQAVTTEIGTDDDTSAYDWGFSLIPVNAATTSVIVPYAPGSAGLTNNYSPVWVTTFANTTLYVDRDGDGSTGANVDPLGSRYDFSCAVTALRSYTIYDDGTSNCYRPSQDSAAGGDRDMTGARIYTVDQTRLVSAWGQRSSYVAGSPGLDVGTTILPFPSITMFKSSAVVGDADADGRADPGDTVEYTIGMTNLGIVDVGAVLVTDEVPDYSAYLPGSLTLDGGAQADDTAPYSPFPADADSPAGGLAVGTIAAGATRTMVFRVVVDDPLPFGVGSLLNLATMSTSLGRASAVNLLPLDAGLRIDKTADAGPVDPGDTINYAIQVFNGTPIAQTGVSLTDTLPAGVTFVPGSASGNLSGSPVTVGPPPNLVSGLTMPRGSLLTVTFRVTVDDPLPLGTRQLVNSAAAASTEVPGPVTDDATTQVARGPEPVVGKTPDPASVPEPGGPVTFTVTVGNPGTGDITLIGLADDVFGDLRDPANPAVSANTCPAQPAVIPAGGTFSCSFAAALAGEAGDPDHEDTVTASVADGAGRPGTGSATAAVPFTDVPPALAVTKAPGVGSVLEPGGPVTFSVIVDNLSVEPVTLATLADSVFGDLRDAANPAVSANTCPARPALLAVGGSLVCSFQAFVPGDAGDPDHTDTVTAAAADDEGNTASGTDDAVVAFSDVLPWLRVNKAPLVGAVPEPGGPVTFAVLVENLSVEPVTLTALADDVFGDLRDPANPAVSANTCPAQPALLPVGGSLACTFEALLAGDAGDPDHTDTVTAAAADDEGNTASASDDATVGFSDVLPSIAVTKAPAVGSVPEPGGTVTFTVGVASLSVEPVTLTALADDVFGDLRDPANPSVSANTCPSQPAVIPVGGTFTCSFDAYLSGDAGDPDHSNRVTATVTDDEGNRAGASDAAAVSFGDSLPAITVSKVPSVGAVAEPGGTVRFTVQVGNAAAEPVTLTALADDVFGDLLDPANPSISANTCPSQPALIPVGGTFTCSFDAYLSGDAGDPDHVDTVTAIAVDDEGNSATDHDEAAVAFGDTAPAVDVAKGAVPGAVPEPGGTVTFTVALENLSVEPVTVMDLSDDVFGDLLDPANALVSANTCPAQPALIPAGGSFTCSFDAYLSGDAGDPDHVDTVTAIAVDDEGNPATDHDEAAVRFGDVLPAISASKAALPGAVAEPGGLVTFTVVVANGPVEAVALTALSDDVFGDLLDPANALVSDNTCPSQPLALPAGGTFACSFDAFVAGGFGDPDHQDTVTATAVDDEGNPASGAATAAVAFLDALPEIAVTKTATPGEVPEPGGVVRFEVVVENLSVETVTLIALTDDVFGDVRNPANPALSSNTCPAQPATLPAGGSLSCSFEAYLPGNAAGPDHADTVTATAEDDDGNLALGRDDAAVTFTDVLPEMTVAKTPSPGALPEPGGVASFLVEVANLSAEPLTLSALSDDVFGDLLDSSNPAVAANNCPAQPSAIPAGGVFVCTFDATLAGHAGGPGHRDTVTGVAADDEGNRASASDDALVAFTDVTPSVSVAKTPAPGAVPESGGVVLFLVEVANTSVEPVTLASLTDSVFGDLRFAGNPAVSSNTCPAQPAVIPVGGTFACSFEARVAGEASGPAHHNTVTAAVVDDEGNPASGDDDASVVFGDLVPTIDVVKTPAVGAVPEPGGVVAFAVAVHNTSAEEVTILTLADSVFGDLLDPANPMVVNNTCPAQAAAVPAGGMLACSFEALIAGDAGGPDHANTVQAVGRDSEGNTTAAADDAAVAFSDVLPQVAVVKRVSPRAVPEPGAVASFQVSVENLGIEPVVLRSLTDDVFGDLLDRDNPAVTGNTCAAQVREIPPAGSLACSFDGFVAGDASGPKHVDTVTATVADDEGNTAAADDRAVVAFGDTLPGIEVAKTASPSAVDEPGGVVTFYVEVANASAEPVTLVSLADSVFGDLLDASNPAVFENTCPAQPPGLLPGGALACSFEAFVAGEGGGPDHVDTVTAVAVDDEGNPASAAAAAVVAFLETEALVSGHLFVDVDGDGGQGPDEPDLAGVRVRLVDGAGNRITVTSDSRGDWEAMVKAGVVAMRVVAATVPVGYRLTTDNDAQRVALLPGASVATGDVGYQPADGSIAGKVFFDVNGNGAQGAGEPPFAGVAVALYDGGRLLGTVLTGSDGSYSFDGLPAGDYTVVVQDDTSRFTGFRVTVDPDGPLDGEAGVGLGPSEHRTGVDFAYRGTGSVGDTVWNDADGDKAQDADEPAIAGVVVGLVWPGFDGVLGSADDVTFPPQPTNSGGIYRFVGVPPGVVAVAVDPASVDDDLVTTTGTSYDYSLGPGEDYRDGDIGYRVREELPYTGFEAGRLGSVALGMVVLGLALLLVGRAGGRRERLRWERLP